MSCSQFQSEMNRFFNTFGNGGAVMRRWSPARGIRREKTTHTVLRADLPGVSESDVKIELDDNVLTISGERKSAHEETKEGYYRVERAYGSFSRMLTLLKGVYADSISANFDRGVLEVKIPKPEQRKPRKVEIGRRQPADDRGRRRDRRADNIRVASGPLGRSGPLVYFVY